MQTRLSLLTLQTEAKKHGLTIAKSKGCYTLIYSDSSLSIFDKSASNLALTQEWLNDCILLKSYDIDLTAPYDKDTIQTVLDKYCPSEWEVIVRPNHDGRTLCNEFRADILPNILKVAELWKAGKYADIDPAQLASCLKHCEGLTQIVKECLDEQGFLDITKFDLFLKQFLPNVWSKQDWQNNKSFYSKALGDKNNDRVKLLNLLGCKVYLYSLKQRETV